jgi:hypothetical protein
MALLVTAYMAFGTWFGLVKLWQLAGKESDCRPTAPLARRHRRGVQTLPVGGGDPSASRASVFLAT